MLMATGLVLQPCLKSNLNAGSIPRQPSQTLSGTRHGEEWTLPQEKTVLIVLCSVFNLLI